MCQPPIQPFRGEAGRNTAFNTSQVGRMQQTASSHIANVANVYAAMRPYLPGAAYVNYCDLDLQNWADAYWGPNLPRLSAVKAAYDGDNLFHHAQSVPVGSVV
jgi:hypothetical protein